ncbi:YfgM family protein [Sphingomonas edaphi]|uniref:Uncharacterized protein n=1 Tax=Sphingomonas edaphi TaxID=2315689 RepID=A0A418Q0N4_9SPHN|nr:hypothetical protein [Sphingomonas edaphi]RIX31479.1 hypothetical protein D3M59_00110 [Sphingomonas edaphi]
MKSDDWYRNHTWSDDIEAAFNAKLARSRSQKAQYLRIQGSILKDAFPAAAIQLLRRCVEEGDDFHIAHAYLDMAHAHYVSGDIEAALRSLEDAMDQQRRQPLFRTSALYDYGMLVALHERAERYDRALSILEGANDAPFASMVFQAEAARALIFAARGQTRAAVAAARRALSAEAEEVGWIPGHPEVGVISNHDNPLSKRLREVVTAATS